VVCVFRCNRQYVHGSAVRRVCPSHEVPAVHAEYPGRGRQPITQIRASRECQASVPITGDSQVNDVVCLLCSSFGFVESDVPIQ
jgi:hypothetical protein